jgi:hypothetical protein
MTLRGRGAPALGAANLRSRDRTGPTRSDTRNGNRPDVRHVQRRVQPPPNFRHCQGGRAPRRSECDCSPTRRATYSPTIGPLTGKAGIVSDHGRGREARGAQGRRGHDLNAPNAADTAPLPWRSDSERGAGRGAAGLQRRGRDPGSGQLAGQITGAGRGELPFGNRRPRGPGSPEAVAVGMTRAGIRLPASGRSRCDPHGRSVGRACPEVEVRGHLWNRPTPGAWRDAR